MSKERGEGLCTECLTGAQSAIGESMEISPEAFELLRSATIPSEFFKIVREFTPRTDVLSPTTPERFPTSAETGEPSIERPMLKTPVERELAMPTEPWPEELPGPELEMPVEPEWEEVLWAEPEEPPKPPEDVYKGRSRDVLFD